MSQKPVDTIWQEIVAVLEHKLQFGFLEQAKSISKVELNGGELTLHVNSDEAFDYFSAEVNQQRLIIQGRPVIQLQSVSVIRTDD